MKKSKWKIEGGIYNDKYSIHTSNLKDRGISIEDWLKLSEKDKNKLAKDIDKKNKKAIDRLNETIVYQLYGTEPKKKDLKDKLIEELSPKEEVAEGQAGYVLFNTPR